MLIEKDASQTIPEKALTMLLRQILQADSGILTIQNIVDRADLRGYLNTINSLPLWKSYLEAVITERNAANSLLLNQNTRQERLISLFEELEATEALEKLVHGIVVMPTIHTYPVSVNDVFDNKSGWGSADR